MLGRWRKRQKRLPMWQRFRNDMRMRLISGLLVIVPLGITVFALGFLYDLTAGKLSPFIKKWTGPVPEYVIPAISIFVFFAALYTIGVIANFVVGRKLLALAEALIERIPVVKTIYVATKQVVEAFSPKEGEFKPKEVVLIEWPSPGMKAVGFLTGRIKLPDGREYLKVFVPTAPNISVGIFQLVALKDAYACKLSTEEAIKLIVSAGIIAPRSITLKPM